MSGSMSIKCQWTQGLFFHHLIQHNPSTVLCWVVFAGPVPELYQINLDQRLGLIIIFVYLSAFFFSFFLSNSTKQSRGFKLWKAFVEVEQWKHLFQLGLLSPSVQMGGEHGGTVPGLGSLPVLHALVSEVVEVHVAAQRMVHRNLLAHASSAPGIWWINMDQMLFPLCFMDKTTLFWGKEELEGMWVCGPGLCAEGRG